HQTYPICQKCEKRHLGECRRPLGLCFHCGEPGHIKPQCPQLMSQTRMNYEPSIIGGRPHSGGRLGGRTSNFSNNNNNYNSRRDESQMSRAGGQPRIFAMRREEANAAPEVVTGAAGNQEHPDQSQEHSCCPRCHHKG
ncbi:unnamed protein product, partial [Linum tenue]